MKAWVTEPNRFQKLNGWITIIWFVAAFPICIFLSQSVPFLVFISVYAVVTGHLSTWQAARTENMQADSDKKLHEAIKRLRKLDPEHPDGGSSKAQDDGP